MAIPAERIELPIASDGPTLSALSTSLAPATAPTMATGRDAGASDTSWEQPASHPITARSVHAPTFAEALICQLQALGVEHAFGISGGSIALFFDAIADSPIALHHFRHETGAAFAATEAYFASGHPTVVFTTTGPGLLNALTGLTAARWDGAKVILVSSASSAAQRGRWATQETSSYTMPQDTLFSSGPIFDFATRVEHPAELAVVARRLALGMAQPGGFVAHLSLPMGMLSSRLDQPHQPIALRFSAPAPNPLDVETCARRLHAGSFAVWLGFGARQAVPQVRRLIELTGAPVFCSPRAKGIVSEHHPRFIGVTGLGGHEVVSQYMLRERPSSVLVLGSRLGEATSFWDRDLVPDGGFLHVDIDPGVPGVAYPEAETLAIHADIGLFLDALLERLAPHRSRPDLKVVPLASDLDRLSQPGRCPVRPRVLMQEIQRAVIQGSDALVLAECGNAFAWCNHYLRFSSPRYRVSTLFGSMGHASAGVVGAALARQGKAVAIVGDGSMLMSSELSSAVQYGAAAVWLVLNDSGYAMCRDGHRALGLSEKGFDFPPVDFVGLAESVGADGVRVESEDQLPAALEQAMASPRPFIVDIVIDTNEASPVLERFESLIHQGGSKNVAGWET